MARKAKQPAAPKQSSPTPEPRPRRAARKRSKKQSCLHLLERSKGVTLAELRQATGWQAHTVRGFLSGTVRKIEGVTLTSEAEAGKSRRYRVTTAQVDASS